MSEITAAQARANSESSNHGVDDVVKGISFAIESVSKTGATHVVHMLSKQAVSEAELQGAIAKLEDRGFAVERMATTGAQYTIKVSW